MNFVYICRGGDNESLRYSIRSVVNSFPDCRIWIVGGVPNWYSGEKISIEQNSNKWQNAIDNLNAITASKEIPDEFILMNDDFFIIDKIDSIKHYHEGPILDKIERYKKANMHPEYLRMLGSTYSRLQRMGIDNPISYETHTPMTMIKDRLAEVMPYCPPSFWRSLYGNLHHVGGEQIKDVKVYSSKRYCDLSYDYTKFNFPLLSTDNESYLLIRDAILKDKFKAKSKYER